MSFKCWEISHNIQINPKLNEYPFKILENSSRVDLKLFSMCIFSFYLLLKNLVHTSQLQQIKIYTYNNTAQTRVTCTSKFFFENPIKLSNKEIALPNCLQVSQNASAKTPFSTSNSVCQAIH